MSGTLFHLQRSSLGHDCTFGKSETDSLSPPGLGRGLEIRPSRYDESNPKLIDDPGGYRTAIPFQEVRTDDQQMTEEELRPPLAYLYVEAVSKLVNIYLVVNSWIHLMVDSWVHLMVDSSAGIIALPLCDFGNATTSTSNHCEDFLDLTNGRRLSRPTAFGLCCDVPEPRWGANVLVHFFKFSKCIPTTAASAEADSQIAAIF
ncbi:hypothetical protein DFH09DRAFT_1093671 [Mycena vulgaris]|nr:hypothetical protein DFH09DRAFT_1093671 [Mycena vulgaris]